MGVKNPAAKKCYPTLHWHSHKQMSNPPDVGTGGQFGLYFAFSCKRRDLGPGPISPLAKPLDLRSQTVADYQTNKISPKKIARQIKRKAVCPLAGETPAAC